MNKWFRRAVGTVGIASGALLLGAGTAQASDAGTAAQDPQLLHGLVEQYFSPMSGLPDTGLTESAANVGAPGVSGAGLSVDTPGQRTTAGALPDAPPVMNGTNNGQTGVVVHAPDGRGERRDVFFGGKTPDVFRALPITDVVPSEGLGLPGSASAESTPLNGGGIPVRNVPLSVPPALPDGNSLGLPDARSLPPGAGLPVGGGLPTTGGLPVGNGLPTTGGLPLDGPSEAGRLAKTTRTIAESGANPVLAMTGTGTEAGTADGLPVLGGLLAERVLPVRGNVNTLPNSAPIPLGESARPELGEGLPVFGQLTGGGLPLGGGLTRGGLPLGGGPLGGGGLHRLTNYVPRHATGY